MFKTSTATLNFVPKDGMINGKPMEFVFNGDDDVWVYIDDVLVLEIGGTHGPVQGTINFATGEVVDPNYGYSNGTVRKRYSNLKETFRIALGDKYDETMFNEEGGFVDYSKHTLKFFYLERGGQGSQSVSEGKPTQNPAYCKEYPGGSRFF